MLLQVGYLKPEFFFCKGIFDLGRFGRLQITGGAVTGFAEKPDGNDGDWINGGFFVLSPRIMDYIDDASIMWEQQPLEKLAKEGQLSAYTHEGFWHPMDTLRDTVMLEELWASGKAPWKVWK